MVIARAIHPIPFRTRPLSAVAPMVLRLKTWESRSPPNLERNRTYLSDDVREQKAPALGSAFFVMKARKPEISAQQADSREHAGHAAKPRRARANSNALAFWSLRQVGSRFRGRLVRAAEKSRVKPVSLSPVSWLAGNEPGGQHAPSTGR